MNSSSSSTCANESTCWDDVGDADVCSVVNLSVTTPENLYLMGKEACIPLPLTMFEDMIPQVLTALRDSVCVCAFPYRYGFIRGGSAAVGGSADIQEQAS